MGIVDTIFGKSAGKRNEVILDPKFVALSADGPIASKAIPTDFQVLEKYALALPFAYAVIAENPNDKIPYYFIDEVQLSEREKVLYEKIITTLQIEVKAPRDETNLRQYFEDQAKRTVNRYRLMKDWGTDV